MPMLRKQITLPAEDRFRFKFFNAEQFFIVHTYIYIYIVNHNFENDWKFAYYNRLLNEMESLLLCMRTCFIHYNTFRYFITKREKNRKINFELK